MAGSGSALVASLKSATRDVEILECKNVELKKEIEQMKKENELVLRKFEIEVSERLKLHKEFEELKVLNSDL
ncbi:hypothetical protein M5689_008279 [Euphorbia peplus]|nr:hypothetical protein M5689_008279 [Euphorbia peplus]